MKARYKFMFVVAWICILLGGYSLAYFSHHDSIYAEGCPEQKTLLWCK